jgi:hypothetical protein
MVSVFLADKKAPPVKGGAFLGSMVYRVNVP